MFKHFINLKQIKITEKFIPMCLQLSWLYSLDVLLDTIN